MSFDALTEPVPIFLRVAGLIVRFLLADFLEAGSLPVVPEAEPASRLRACSMRAISASIADTTSFMLMLARGCPFIVDVKAFHMLASATLSLFILIQALVLAHPISQKER